MCVRISGGGRVPAPPQHPSRVILPISLIGFEHIANSNQSIAIITKDGEFSLPEEERGGPGLSRPSHTTACD